MRRGLPRTPLLSTWVPIFVSPALLDPKATEAYGRKAAKSPTPRVQARKARYSQPPASSPNKAHTASVQLQLRASLPAVQDGGRPGFPSLLHLSTSTSVANSPGRQSGQGDEMHDGPRDSPANVGTSYRGSRSWGQSNTAIKIHRVQRPTSPLQLSASAMRELHSVSRSSHA